MLSEQKVAVKGKFGLHLRAAGRFAEIANGYRSSITVVMSGREVNGKSILEMLTLGATAGSELTIRTEGADAKQALGALLELFEEPRPGEEGGPPNGD